MIVAGRFPFPDWTACRIEGDGVDRAWAYHIQALRKHHRSSKDSKSADQTSWLRSHMTYFKNILETIKGLSSPTLLVLFMMVLLDSFITALYTDVAFPFTAGYCSHLFVPLMYSETLGWCRMQYTLFSLLVMWLDWLMVIWPFSSSITHSNVTSCLQMCK